jgi:Insertion element 4 transposase N-terminal
LDSQSVITRTIPVAGGVFVPGHLGELTQIVPFEMVDEVLAQTKATQQRIRTLPSRVVMYLLLAAGLSVKGCLLLYFGSVPVSLRNWASADSGFVG